MRRIVFVAAVTLLIAAAASAAPDPIFGRQPGQRITGRQAQSDASEGWPKYCGTLTMSGTPTGVSPLTPENVSRLSLAWKLALKGPIASAPSILHNRLYIGDWSGYETLADTATGGIVAQANLGQTNAPQCTPAQLGVTSSPAIAGGRVYVAGGDNAFYAL